MLDCRSRGAHARSRAPYERRVSFAEWLAFCRREPVVKKMLDMFDADTGLELRHSYFRRSPYVEDEEPDYLDPEATTKSRSYWFHHTLGDVIGGVLRSGMTLTHFEELEHDKSTVFRHLQGLEIKPALAYALVARAS